MAPSADCCTCTRSGTSARHPLSGASPACRCEWRCTRFSSRAAPSRPLQSSTMLPRRTMWPWPFPGCASWQRSTLRGRGSRTRRSRRSPATRRRLQHCSRRMASRRTPPGRPGAADWPRRLRPDRSYPAPNGPHRGARARAPRSVSCKTPTSPRSPTAERKGTARRATPRASRAPPSSSPSSAS